jgi:hypothetical protein
MVILNVKGAPTGEVGGGIERVALAWGAVDNMEGV